MPFSSNLVSVVVLEQLYYTSSSIFKLSQTQSIVMPTTGTLAQRQVALRPRKVAMEPPEHFPLAC